MCVTTCQSTLRIIPEQRTPHLHCSRSLKSCIMHVIVVMWWVHVQNCFVATNIEIFPLVNSSGSVLWLGKCVKSLWCPCCPSCLIQFLWSYNIVACGWKSSGIRHYAVGWVLPDIWKDFGVFMFSCKHSTENLIFEDKGAVFLWNVKNCSPSSKVSHPRGHKSSATLLGEPQRCLWFMN